MLPLQFFRTALLLGNIHLFQGCQANLDIRPRKKLPKRKAGEWVYLVTTFLASTNFSCLFKINVITRVLSDKDFFAISITFKLVPKSF